jgi:hypothetical protein
VNKTGAKLGKRLVKQTTLIVKNRGRRRIQ